MNLTEVDGGNKYIHREFAADSYPDMDDWVRSLQEVLSCFFDSFFHFLLFYFFTFFYLFIFPLHVLFSTVFCEFENINFYRSLYHPFIRIHESFKISLILSLLESPVR